MMLDLWNNLSEGWQIAIIFSILLPIICFIGIHLIKANKDFFKILDEFQEKLPPSHKKAKVGVGIEPFNNITVIDTSKMSTILTTQDIDLFMKKLELFKYNRIIFRRKKTQRFSENLQRIIRTSAWDKFGIAVIQNLLEDENFESKKPYLFGTKIGKFIGF